MVAKEHITIGGLLSEIGSLLINKKYVSTYIYIYIYIYIYNRVIENYFYILWRLISYYKTKGKMSIHAYLLIQTISMACKLPDLTLWIFIIAATLNNQFMLHSFIRNISSINQLFQVTPQIKIQRIEVGLTSIKAIKLVNIGEYVWMNFFFLFSSEGSAPSPKIVKLFLNQPNY